MDSISAILNIYDMDKFIKEMHCIRMYLKMWKWKDPMDGWIDLIATTAQVE